MSVRVLKHTKWNPYHNQRNDGLFSHEILLHYFTLSSSSEKPIKVVIRHLPSDKPAEDISNSLEDLGFNVINVRQTMANRRTPHGQAYVETLPLILDTLERLALCSATTAKTSAMFGPTASNSLMLVARWWPLA
jgi:hypothetical protein